MIAETCEIERIIMLLEIERSIRIKLESKLNKAEHDRDRYKRYIESLRRDNARI